MASSKHVVNQPVRNEPEHRNKYEVWMETRHNYILLKKNEFYVYQIYSFYGVETVYVRKGVTLNHLIDNFNKRKVDSWQSRHSVIDMIEFDVNVKVLAEFKGNMTIKKVKDLLPEYLI